MSGVHAICPECDQDWVIPKGWVLVQHLVCEDGEIAHDFERDFDQEKP